MKKGELFGNAVLSIIVTIVVVFLLVFGVQAFATAKKNQCEAALNQFKLELQGDVDNQRKKYQSDSEFVYALPCEVEQVLFVDLERGEELKYNTLISEYPIIKDSILSGANRNLFLLDEEGILASMSLGGIEIANLGGQNCTGIGVVEGQQGKIEMRMRGRAGKTVLGDSCDNIRRWTFDFSVNALLDAQKMPGTHTDRQATADHLEIQDNSLTLKEFPGPQHTYYYNGSFVSPQFHLPEATKLSKLTWSKNAVGTIKFQFGSRAVEKSPASYSFTGPDGTENSFYTNFGQSLFSASGNTFFKVKIFMETDNRNATPVLEDFTITYYIDPE